MLVEINAKSMRINSRDSGPSLQQSRAADRTGGQRTELGHGPPVAGDCETFPRLHPINNLAAMVAKVANRNLGHSPKCITRETGPVWRVLKSRADRPLRAWPWPQAGTV